jgi:uncharacterized protein
MSPEKLNALTKRELASMAKRRRIGGWHAMKKAELIQALARHNGSNGRANGRSARSSQPTAKTNGTHAAGGGKKELQAQSAGPRPLSTPTRRFEPQNYDGRPAVDRLQVTARDSYWLEVHWELSAATIARAESAFGARWHQAVPVLRIFALTADDTSAATEMRLYDVPIQPDAETWFVQVDAPPHSFKVHLGYVAPDGKFFALARSRPVTTPRPGAMSPRAATSSRHRLLHGRAVPNGVRDSVRGDSASPHRPPLGLRPNLPPPSIRAKNLCRQTAEDGSSRKFEFRLDAELLIHGSAHPQAELTLLGDVVPVRPDGTFAFRFDLSDGRQVIPAVMLTPDGTEQRTILLAIERNTKTLEPQSMDDLEH